VNVAGSQSAKHVKGDRVAGNGMSLHLNSIVDNDLQIYLQIFAQFGPAGLSGLRAISAHKQTHKFSVIYKMNTPSLPVYFHCVVRIV